MHIVILGVNGFIGSHLLERILDTTDWHVSGLDMNDHHIREFLDDPRFSFKHGNMVEEQAWIEEKIKTADAVLPLVAIANPALYVKHPLKVFELDFEANLTIVRLCVKHQKRIIFPSTSEVYGMCTDERFDEETSPFIQGPINKQRWIYSCSKQLMDRVIAAYAQEGQLEYTLFRPFNFMGPRLDDLHNHQEGASRAFTQFVGNIMRDKPIMLVGGGEQRRCYIYIDDAIQALMKIIKNKNGCASQSILNIGNPNNNVSIRELVEIIVDEMKKIPSLEEYASRAQLKTISAEEYFGEGYQDVSGRVPSIKRAEEKLDWKPETSVREGVRKTLAYYFEKI